MSSRTNYAAYREALEKSPAPTIPFLGVFLRDLAFIDEGNPDILNRKINMEKIKLIGATITKIFSFQDGITASYNDYVLDADVQKYFDETLLTVPNDEADVLYECSITLEPPQSIITDSSSA
jgi:son of sevenless